MPQPLTKVFAGFSKRWRDESWRRTVELAVYWFAAANQCEGGVEGSLVLTLSALEALAWVTCTAHAGLLDAEGFNKLRAQDRIRLLLRHCGIPVAIPPKYEELIKLAKAFNCDVGDSTAVLSFIRNCYVHPTPANEKKLATASDDFKYDAWELGIHLLELALLNACEYGGRYSNRTSKAVYRGGEVELVPWAPKPQPVVAAIPPAENTMPEKSEADAGAKDSDEQSL